MFPEKNVLHERHAACHHEEAVFSQMNVRMKDMLQATM